MPRRLVLALPLLLLSCDQGPKDPYDVKIGSYEAEIRWTEHRVPHILAEDVASVAYGTGYAYAEGNICTLADQIVKVRSERSRYFGVGVEDANLNSDISWKALGVLAHAEDSWFELDEEIRDVLVAYVTGYNDYLAEVGPGGLPAPCRDAEWVVPITHVDLLAHFYHMGQFGSGSFFLNYIATAAPPLDSGARRAAPPTMQAFGDAIRPRDGSNGVALGGDRTENGKGLLISNTHFEQEGEKRWWEFHQTVTGERNVYGVSLTGVPLVNVGFNEHVGWSHTVSTTPHFAIYQLELNPSDPTQYRYDGSFRQMTSEIITVDVKTEGGNISPVTRTLYRSHYGLMLNAPIVGWTRHVAFTYRDANTRNVNMIPTWWAMQTADSVEQIDEAHGTFEGIPWVHTVAADDQGNAFYTDSSSTPNLADDIDAAFEAYLAGDFMARQFKGEGAYVFPGKDPHFEWIDAGNVRSFSVPHDQAPRLHTRDYVSNSNENHWLANATAPAEGYAMMFGEEAAPRQPRTKMSVRIGAGSAAGDDGKYDLEELEAAVLDAPANLSHVLKDQVVQRCKTADVMSVKFDGKVTEVDIRPACPILEAWDGSVHQGAVGAVIWREFVGSGVFKLSEMGAFVQPDDISRKGKLFGDDFDPKNPVQTPNKLKEAPSEGLDPIHQALGVAVLRLAQAEIPLDARLGDVQFRLRGGERFPTAGGQEIEGAFLVSDWRGGDSTLLEPKEVRGEVLNPRTGLTVDGYAVNGGDSWIAVYGFTDDGPAGRAVMTYGQSQDPDSEWFDDQTALYAEHKLRPIRFKEADILADPELVTKTVSHP